MKKILFILTLVFLTSCSDNATDNKDKSASRVDLIAVQTYPGFLDFKSTYDSYIPNSDYVDSLKMVFNSSEDNIYIYLKPECDCNATLQIFPRMMKVLGEAGISQDNIFMYVMEDESYSYPESGILSISYLPQFFTQNGEIVEGFDPDTNKVEMVLYKAFN